MLTRPRLTGVAGAACIAFSGILFRKALVSPSTAAMYRCVLALPLLGLLAWREDRRFGGRPWSTRRPALLAGVLFAADLIFWHRAIDAVGAGLGTVLGNIQVVMVGVAAWLVLGERPAPRTIVAIPIALSGVVLISGVVGAGAYGDDPTMGAVYGLLTSVCYTGFILLLREGNRDLRRPAGPLFDASVVAAVGATLAGVAVGDLDVSPRAAALGWLALLAISSQVVGWLLISVSLPRLPAATTSILLTLQPVASVLLAMALLDEHPSATQLLGGVIVLAALAIATAPSLSYRSAFRAPEATKNGGDPVSRG